ncbi:MAG TPA: zf-HC2 domain-containing protein [Blastocatellia bacterium]
MNCKDSKLKASAYLDGQLNCEEYAFYRGHLLACAGCREHLAETEITSMMLKGAGRVEVPRELRSYIMTAVERESAARINLGQRALNWMLSLNPKPLSYATGVVASLLLFAFMLSGFRPIPVNKGSIAQAFVLPNVTSSGAEYRSYNDIPAGRDPVGNYQLPRVLGSDALVSFSNLAYKKPGNETMWSLIEISPDGTGNVVDMLQEPNDSNMVEQLWWFVTEKSFQPALVEGRPVPTRIVFVSEKIDVSG